MILGNPNSSVRRSFRVRVAASFAIGLAALASLLAATARADEDLTPIVSGAGADWGVKESFRNYIVGPIAHGAIEVGGGASASEDGSFHFPVGAGEYHAPSSGTVVSFAGTVHFSGHEGALELELSNPRVEITPEAAALYADVSSRPNEPGAPIASYPNLRVLDLDTTELTPTVEGGVTTWPPLPAKLTAEAVPAFAGFYPAGTAMDPVSFAYDGPGGLPLAEKWTAPGSALFEPVAAGSIGSGASAIKLDFDPTRERVWVSSYNGKKLTALNQADLTPIGEVGVEHNARNVGVDRADGDVFSVDTSVRRVSDAGGGTFQLDPTAVGSFGSPASNSLAVRQSDGSLFALQPGTLHQYAPEGSGYAHTEYAVPSGYRTLDVSDGNGIFLSSGESLASAVAEVTFDEGSAVVTPVPGTEGSFAAAVAADGTVAASYVRFGESGIEDTELRIVRPDGGGGWEAPEIVEDGEGVTFGLAYTAITPDASRVLVGDFSTFYKKVIVVENGEIAGIISDPSTIADLATAPNGDAYVARADGSIERIDRTGTSPTVVTQPLPRTLSVEPGESADVVLEAAAEGDPAPAVQWQRRPLGSAAWSDLAGEESGTLALSVGAADSGTRYRAVFGNPAGSLASEAVAVTVNVVEPAAEEPPAPTPAAPVPSTTPPAATPLAASAKRPAIRRQKGATRLGRNRTAVVATVRCRERLCRLLVPRKARARVGKRKFGVRVIAPKWARQGRPAKVRVRVSRPVARKLGRRQAKLTLRLTVHGAGKKTTRRLAVRLRR